MFHWGDGTGDTSTASADTVHTYTSPGDYRPSVTITLSNAQVITVQYAAYVLRRQRGPVRVVHLRGPARRRQRSARLRVRIRDQLHRAVCTRIRRSTSRSYGFDPDGGHIATFDVDWNGDGTFDTTGIAAVDDTASINHTFTIDGTYPVVVRAHDDDLPTKTLDGRLRHADRRRSRPTTAHRSRYSTHSPDLPQTNHTITFNASYSYDLDGTVQSYQWDWDQNGTYDSTGASPTHAYSTDGDHYYTLKVTDNQGGVGYETGYVETHTGNHSRVLRLALHLRRDSQHGADRVLRGRRLRRRRHDHPVPVGLGRQRNRRPDDRLELGLARLRDSWNLPSACDARRQRRRQRLELPGLHVHGHGHRGSPERRRRLDAGRAASGQLDLLHGVRLEPQRRDQPVHLALGRRHRGHGDDDPERQSHVRERRELPGHRHRSRHHERQRHRARADREGAVQLAAARVLQREPAVHDDEHVDHVRRHRLIRQRQHDRELPLGLRRRHDGRHDRPDDDAHLLERRARTTSRWSPRTGATRPRTPFDRDITIQAGNCKPQDVYFTYSPQSLPSGSPIAFTGHAVDPDGSISSYTWSWGDGTSDTISPTTGGPTTNHTFANPGLYTIQVIARDNLGLAGSRVLAAADHRRRHDAADRDAGDAGRRRVHDAPCRRIPEPRATTSTTRRRSP